MTPFHVGMRVVCVEAIKTKSRVGEIYPTVGEVYTIRAMFDEPIGICILLDEIINKELKHLDGFGECRFWIGRFRPAHENRMDELRTLLAPVPSKELVQS